MFKFVSRKRKGREDDEDDVDQSSEAVSDAGSSDESSVDSDSEEGSAFGDGEDDNGLGGGLGAEDVLENPLLQDPTNEDVTLCLVCPTKTLKNPTMIEVHEKSNSHQRRLNRFAQCAKDLEEERGRPASVPNILHKMESSTTVIEPKVKPKPRKQKPAAPPKPSAEVAPTSAAHDPTPSTAAEDASKVPRASRKERKKARKERREAFAGVASAPTKTAAGATSDTAGSERKKKKPTKGADAVPVVVKTDGAEAQPKKRVKQSALKTKPAAVERTLKKRQSKNLKSF